MKPLVVVGAGIVGLAAAEAIARRSGRKVVVLEAEKRIAAHQSGNNSGVIHAGLYYKPGSAKALGATRGRAMLYDFLEAEGIAHRRCGKVVVASEASEIPRLDELERRGRANGIEGLQRLDADGLRGHEPHMVGVAGLWVPVTGVVDYREVASALVRRLEDRGGEIRLGHKVRGFEGRGSSVVVLGSSGDVETDAVVCCAGYAADRLARAAGCATDLRIVPFRGEYLRLKTARAHLVKGLIYPVPDPRFPFLGVHFTRRISDEVEAGPSAILATSRLGYRRRDVNPRDLLDVLTSRGAWRLFANYWRMGLAEMWRSVNLRAMAAALGRLVPEISAADLEPAGAGVRAQVVRPDGSLVDDFHFLETEKTIHVLNAPSPAATACLQIGEEIASKAERLF